MRVAGALFVVLAAVAALSACGRAGEADAPSLQGYVEGDFVYAAPEIAGRIADIGVREGAQVEAGALLFTLDRQTIEAEFRQSEAELAAAEAELADRREGQRPVELSVIEAQIDKARASRDQAEKEFQRQQDLFQRGVIAKARLDQASETLSVAEAQLAEARRQKDVATLPARKAQIEAAERQVEAARAGVAQAKTKLAKTSVRAPEAGLIDDVYYRAGEVVAAGEPVLSLLPESERKIVFFVPEPQLAQLPHNAEIAISCDNCPAGLTAKVTRVSAEAEFTPPVIFSEKRRGKLLFRAEARPVGDTARLRVGQPVDVRLVAAEPGS
ncbi:HlyD family efflux transporter periplasmic adaptor subunit [Afifella sp. H1R]|uniref:HlyD family secretion protein n=1 Tax=Afifella sp. H1R TaxID=2908841 RepID=UPI001F17419E|nr:HlyD family efflux transporter periplasmic adaptor subunit [Afifella sp. H1R]MCF1504648.1 HlyD family efflux transporter periplasmic adaptor subunit [Afifella sp. H1R]